MRGEKRYEQLTSPMCNKGKNKEEEKIPAQYEILFNKNWIRNMFRMKKHGTAFPQ